MDAGPDLDFGIVGEFSGYWAGTMCRIASGDGYVILSNGDNGRRIAEHVIGAGGAAMPFRDQPEAADGERD
ncbi:hypothetical protein GCM10025331_56070 [Actinoplanes utahensis]|nr:hypothetical protein Aut01nite_63650 [Actinoplanes utahensis]